MRARAVPERGQATIDYVGAVVVVVVVITALFATGAAASIGRQIAWGVCSAAAPLTGAECESPSSSGATASGNPSELSPADQAYAGDYVALGDSYSSGEGADDYVDNTNSDDATKQWIDDLPVDLWPGDPHVNVCRRSANAYSSYVFANGDFAGDYVFGACSGAISSDYYEDNHSGNEGEGPQREHITDDTSLITLSMGGNDFGFGDVMAECVKRGLGLGAACGPDATADAQDDIDAKVDELIQMYRDLEADAPDDARILVVGYPRLFPEDPTGPTWGIAQRDQTWINDLGTYANDAIRRAIAESGTRIEFVDVTDALAGHESGTDDPWLHDLKFGVDGGNWLVPVSSNSYHPTADGQEAIGEIVQDAVVNGGDRP